MFFYPGKHERIVLTFILCLFSFIHSFTQFYSRVEAGISIKEINETGGESLLVGNVYYNKNIRQIYFDFYFPKESKMVINDTATIDLTSGKSKGHKLSSFLIDFSVLNLFLNQELEYYGLKESPFQMVDINHDQGMVISTWEIPENLTSTSTGQLVLSQKDGLLFGLVTFDQDNNLVSKQFFKDYINIHGMMFPSKIIQISYLNKEEKLKRVTTYRNIKINEDQTKIYYKPLVLP